MSQTGKPAAPPFAYLLERFPAFTQTFIARELRALGERGVHPHIFSIRPGDGSLPNEELPESVISRVVYLPPIKEMTAQVRAWKDEKVLPHEAAKTLREWDREAGDKNRVYEACWLGQRLRELRVRHVHVHFAGIAARTAWWLRRIYGISYSFTAHANDYMVTPAGVSQPTLEQLVDSARFVVNVSRAGARQMREDFPKVRRKIITIYNGLDWPEELPPRGEEAGTPGILSVGRLIEKKGFPDLIKACAQLKAAEVDFHCQIVGDGPLEEELRALIAQLDVEREVELLGARPQPEVRQLLVSARVFALACRKDSEGGMDNLPTVITEAMAYGLPVVSTRLAGVPEQVLHGKTGLLVDPGNVDALAGALQKLLHTPGEAEQMGTAAYEYGRVTFASERTAEQLADELTASTNIIPRPAHVRVWLRRKAANRS